MITLMSPSMKANVGHKANNVKANTQNFGQLRFGKPQDFVEISGKINQNSEEIRKTIFDDLIKQCGDEGKNFIDSLLQVAQNQKNNEHAHIYIDPTKKEKAGLNIKIVDTKSNSGDGVIHNDDIPLSGFSRFKTMGTASTFVTLPDFRFALKDADDMASVAKDKAILRQEVEDSWQKELS